MDTYVILRRGGWRSPAELPAGEIIKVADPVIVHPDPEAAAA